MLSDDGESDGGDKRVNKDNSNYESYSKRYLIEEDFKDDLNEGGGK